MRCKALVIGGGPSGTAASEFLSAGGMDTILLERDLSFIKPCGGGIPSGAFEEFDLPESLIKRKIDKVKLFSPTGRTVEVRTKSGFIAIVDRGEFDAALRRKAEVSGARLIEGRFLGFSESGDTVCSEAVINGRPARIVSDYVIAADGINSRSRAALGIKPVSSIYTLTGRYDSAPSDACEFWLGNSHAPRFYSWVFPRPGGITAGTGGYKTIGMRELFENFLKRRGLPPAMNMRGYRIPLWGKDVFRKGRVLFAGDSAGQVMPFTFEGIYYAMRSGRFAAEAVLSGKPESYEKLWRRRFHRRFTITKGLWSRFLKDENAMERFVSLCERPSVQEICMGIWIKKKSDTGSLVSFLNLFKEFL